MDDPEYPERTFVVMPTIGKFIIRIHRHNDYRTKKLDYYTIMIGNSPRDPCVTISVPYNSNEPMKLAYVTSEVECTLDNVSPIKGIATIQMIQLGITIARELSPKPITMELEDCSHFNCSTPHGIKKMALPSFYIAFHGKTWYEDKFGAQIKDPIIRQKYNDGILRLDDESAKPDNFRFGNSDIADELYDLYLKSNTWKAFFTNIDKKYKQRKCWVIQPWIEDAMRHIFKDGLIYEMKTWTFPLKNIPIISYYELSESVKHLGGGWKHSTMERIMYRTSFYPFSIMKYKRFLRQTRSKKHKRGTRKLRFI
jgi:hypothetical protein